MGIMESENYAESMDVLYDFIYRCSLEDLDSLLEKFCNNGKMTAFIIALASKLQDMSCVNEAKYPHILHRNVLNNHVGLTLRKFKTLGIYISQALVNKLKGFWRLSERQQDIYCNEVFRQYLDDDSDEDKQIERHKDVFNLGMYKQLVDDSINLDTNIIKYYDLMNEIKVDIQ